ncbi:MAG: hypothetical protein ACXWLC_10810 [Rhizomicrobium sp.]
MTGYIAKHWRGQFPLAQSFWLNGGLALLPFAVWFELAGDYLVAHPPASPSTFILVFVPSFLVFALIDVWAGVGIWRSAGRRILFGRRGWAWAARAAISSNFAVLILACVMLVNKTHAIVSPAHDMAGSYEVTLRGTTAVLHGQITKAAADELELLLNDKTVKRLAIAVGSGGEIGPALRLAKLIHARRLFVVALAQCDGACTLLLAAGGARAAVPETIIGFNAGTAETQQVYREAGLAGPLLDSLRRQQVGAMYEPTLRVLIENRFLTDIFVDASRRYVRAPLWCAKNLVVCARTGRQNGDADKRPGGNGDGT